MDSSSNNSGEEEEETIQERRRKWALNADKALAEQLQIKEFKERYELNKRKNSQLREDLSHAKSLAQQIEEKTALQIEMDRELAKQLAEIQTPDAEIVEPFKLDKIQIEDKIDSKLEADEETAKQLSENQTPELEIVEPFKLDKISVSKSIEKLLQEKRDHELAQRLQKHEDEQVAGLERQ